MKKICSICEREFQSNLNGKPFCATHYRLEREKYKNQILKDVLMNVRKTVDENPQFRALIDLNLLNTAVGLFRELKHPDKTKAANTAISTLQSKIDDLTRLVQDMAKKSTKD